MSLLVVGSVAFDDVETCAGKRERLLGGSANYACLAASYFTKVRMVGVVGEDYPDEIIEIFQNKGIDTEGLAKVKGETFAWGGVYSDDFSERTTLYTDLNVFAEFEPVLPSSYTNSSHVFLGNIHPALQIHVLEQLTEPKFIACDTMNLWINTTLSDLKELLKKINLLIINDEEALMLSGGTELTAAAKEILSMGPEILVIKKGKDGSSLFGDGIQFDISAYPVGKVVDPTGAGDTFAGGLMGRLAAEASSGIESLRSAMRAGSVMASFCVEAFGLEGLLEASSETVRERMNNPEDVAG